MSDRAYGAGAAPGEPLATRWNTAPWRLSAFFVHERTGEPWLLELAPRIDPV